VSRIKERHGKRIYIEKQHESLEPKMKAYKADIKSMEDNPEVTGAIFFGVFRGKLSEGISLNDEYCRCVLSVGIPYGAISDPRTILKRELLSNK
jgi:Rad3-related DNA helicase